MKMITAFIKPHKLMDVTTALKEIKSLSGASVADTRGFGRGRATDAPDKIMYDTLDYLPRIRIDVACDDHMVDWVVSVIETKSHTGLRGDGKIYVTTIDQAVRISTGERGDAAV